ncbi:MAG: 2-phosphosulfolactate phosphatase [Pelosinus sp.]|nr:2-phosphosulfolactate phosphatase [Pelosinus sp.]
MNLDVAFLPKEISHRDISDTVCIVLDIFRATTSMVTAFSHGCKTIIPVESIEDAHKVGQQHEQALFAGERKSIKIEGFDFGNSPFDFSRDKVLSQTIIMTTTNGTIAVKAAEQAYCTLIGAFINAEAVARQAQLFGKDILIVCAGTEGKFSLEDALCAGYLIELLAKGQDIERTDAATGALLMYTAARQNLFAAAKTSRNGQRLVELKRVNEIEYCVRQNIIAIVPEYRDKQIELY